jgi:hypothetical protein
MPCVPYRDLCCLADPRKGTCSEYDGVYVESSVTSAVVVDDDGDPLDVATAATGGCLSATAAPQPCAGAACSPTMTMCGVRWFCGVNMPVGVLSVAAGDGLASVAGTIDVAGTCSP